MMAQPFRYMAHNGELNTDKKIVSAKMRLHVSTINRFVFQKDSRIRAV